MIARFASACISLMLFGMAVAKLVSGHEKGFFVGPMLYYCLAAVEIVIAFALWSRHRQLALRCALLFFGAAAISAVIWKGDCGCAGTLFPMGSNARLFLAGLGGVLASLAVRGVGGRPRQQACARIRPV